MDPAVKRFATLVLQELCARDPRAAGLVLQPAPCARSPVLGCEVAGTFQPLLRLDSASAAANVMSLWVWHHGRWQPTFERGTPAQLADLLAGPLHYLWTIALSTADYDPETSVQ